MLSITLHKHADRFAEIFLNQIKTAETFDALSDICWKYANGNGVSMATYCHLPPPGASDYAPMYTAFEKGYPKGWAEKYYSERLYNIDPIPKYVVKRAEPCWWSDIINAPEIGADGKKFMLMGLDYGIKEGLSIPVFGPNGRNATVGLGFDAYQVRISPLTLAYFQSMAQLGHHHYCRLLNNKHKEDIKLSDREQEILNWVVKGKSNSVIAEIIGVSSYTVDTYLKRIFSKLGVSSRITAALRGMSIGLVS